MEKFGISQLLTGVRRQPVRTGAGTLCAQSSSAYKYTLCLTQRVHIALKVKKNKN